MSTATRGRAYEHRVRDDLVAHDWRFIMRSAGSKGPADIIVAHPIHGLALVQIGAKSKTLGPADRDRALRRRRTLRIPRHPRHRHPPPADQVLARHPRQARSVGGMERRMTDSAENDALDEVERRVRALKRVGDPATHEAVVQVVLTIVDEVRASRVIPPGEGH